MKVMEQRAKIRGMRKAQKREMLPAVDLFPQVEYAGRKIDAAKFGPSSYNNNVARMQKRYWHSDSLPNVTFKPLSTVESLAVVSYDFANLVKPVMFDSNWFQAGRILRTQEGVWANLPRDRKGNLISDEKILKKYLVKAQKVRVGNGHIYLGGNDFGFAEYETFARGLQNADTFAQCGLARVLENTPKRIAKNLKAIIDKNNYPSGIEVCGFEPVKDPVLRVVGLYSSGDVFNLLLYIYGDWSNDDIDGYAFGGLVSGEASAQKS